MGSQVIAGCECGVEADIMIGGGLLNFTTTCHFPGLCGSCRNVVQINLLEMVPHCPKCGTANPIPYDDPRLLGAAGENSVAQWNMRDPLGRELILTNGSYQCPNCGKMTLHFTDSGVLWD